MKAKRKWKTKNKERKTVPQLVDTCEVNLIRMERKKEKERVRR